MRQRNQRVGLATALAGLCLSSVVSAITAPVIAASLITAPVIAAPATATAATGNKTEIASVSVAAGSTALPEKLLPVDKPAVAEKEGALAGKRRLALVVGVGKYQAVPQLIGPASDASKVYRLLTDEQNGYRIPKDNVCLLLETAVTKAAFKEAFQKCLVDRAQDGDVVTFYFAGHGSISRDSNGDEADGQDETLMMVDSRTDASHFDLVDDEFNVMLSSLFQKMSGSSQVKEQNVTVILDSCNSGTAGRGTDSTIKARFSTATSGAFDEMAGIGQNLTGGKRWDGESLPGIVFLSAAIDGTSALEAEGEGLFTKSMLQTLQASLGTPITYEQLILRMRPVLASFGSSQKIDVQGGSSARREVFGLISPSRPASYLVKKVEGTSLTLTGTQLPGWSAGATVRIYAGAIGGKSTTRTVEDLKDPTRAIATAVVDKMNGLVAQATVSGEGLGGTIQPGDLAILAIPGKDSVFLPVRITPATQTGGVPDARAKAILSAIDQAAAFKATIRVLQAGESGEAWTLVMDKQNHVQLLDATGALRVTYTPDSLAREPEVVAKNLHQHARQKALLQIQGEAGSDFVNNDTVQVWLEKESEVNEDLLDLCPKQNTGYWDEQKNGPGSSQFQVPLCSNYRIHVKVSAAVTVQRLYVGGLILSSDGSIIGFPGGPDSNEDGYIALKPGEEYTFKRPFSGVPPINVEDRILVFGNREDNKVEWAGMSEPASTRGGNDLANALGAYLSGGTRGVSAGRSSKPSTWTTTYASMKTVANIPPDERKEQKQAGREYTVAQYDIREMLPANQDSALYRLLLKTYEVANIYSDNPDGPRYNQATDARWDTLSDADNLAKGIDCSHAIWFAYTRSGLKYNDRKATANKKEPTLATMGAYIATAAMVDTDSLNLTKVNMSNVPASAMRDQFESCRQDPILRPGDVLVYRRTIDDPKKRTDGHVVMVIDPNTFIAWGSHAWDGNTNKGENKPDTGVEFQQIRKLKTGLETQWQGWDSANMLLVDCWRYKQISREWDESPLNRPGTFDMNTPLESLLKK